MDISLFLKCIQCGNYLGEFRQNQIEYRCAQCEQSYHFANGILDCIGDGQNGIRADISSDCLSSFAELMITPLEIDALNERLEPLYSRIFRDQNRSSTIYLDVGCGYGGLLLAAASKFSLVVGVNTELGELERAATLLNEHGIQNVVLVRASAQELPFIPAQFSAISCVQVLEHVSSPEKTLAQLKSGLTLQGYLYLSVPNRHTLRVEPHTKLPWIGFLPAWLAQWYAGQNGVLEEYRSVRLISYSQLSTWLRRDFGGSYEFIRSGYHQTTLGKIAKRVWHIPFLGLVARLFVGDIEVIVWR